MIISHKYRFIFIKTRKTAGTSIEVFLSPHCGYGDVLTPIHPREEGHSPRNYKGYFNPLPELLGPGRDPKATLQDLATQRRFYNHITAQRVKARVASRIWRDYFTFCFERNPWDKTISHYHMLKDRAGGELAFDEYIARGEFCWNYPQYTEGRTQRNILVDHVAKYENLLEELAQIFAQLGVPFDGRLSIKAKSTHRRDQRSYHEFFSSHQRRVIEDAFRTEVEMHGYTFA
jgi:hypothetical protein